MRLDPEAERVRHEPIQERLERLFRRGQQAGDFDQRLSPTWLAAVTIVLGHTAVEQMTGGRMTADEAMTAMSESILRVFQSQPADPRRRASVGGQAIELDVDPRYPVCYIQAPSLIYQP